MNAPHKCPKCGAALPTDAPEGLCPACLMSGGFDTDATVKMTPSQKPTPSQPAQTPSPQELAPLFPQLEIIELLGRGGMGTVYKARQTKLNRFVALKIISAEAGADPHFAERFQREAQALAKLNHPNIVSVFDFGETGGLFYFLMEFVDGANLRTLIQSGEMKPEAALALIPAFCDALQYAHDEGVVHRDIKPENVLVDKKGRVKIADFGLAKLLGHDTPGDTLTRTGMYLGTPRYMAPEQVEKPETVDHRADIYSLGVVFYEMLTGELPMGRFDPPSKKVQVDVKLDEIVLHALEKEPARRYQHASEIKTDVQGVTSNPSKENAVASAETTTPPTGLDPGTRSKEAIAMAATSMILLGLWSFTILVTTALAFFLSVRYFGSIGPGSPFDRMLALAGLLIATAVPTHLLVSAWRQCLHHRAWMAALGFVIVSIFSAFVHSTWGFHPVSVEWFFGTISLACFLVLRFHPGMPVAFATMAERTRLRSKQQAAASGQPSASPGEIHPMIETAKRMGFVRWLMRWIFSTKPGPGQWRVVIYPLFVSLGVFSAAGGVLTLFKDRIGGVSNPVLGVILGSATGGGFVISVLLWRLHCLWRKYRSGEIADDPKRVAWSDIPADIRHRMLFQWLVATAALLIAAGCFMFVLNDFKTSAFISTTNYELAPHSQKYELLVITPEFEQFMMPGGIYYKRPSETKIGIAIHSKPGKPGADKPNTMTVTLPGMVANYWHPNVTPEQYHDEILDLDNLSRWMSGRCGVEMDEAAQKEAKQLMALLKNFREKPPSCFSEFVERMPALTTEFDWKRWGGGRADIDMPLASMTLLPTVLLFGPLFAFVLALIRRNGWERARARLASKPETPRAAPRVLLRDLPPDIRSTARVRMAVCTLGLALFAGFVTWAVMNRLATTRHDYHITLQPKSSSTYQKIEMQFSFDTSEWHGEHFDVEAAKFPVALAITLADGAKRDLHIELTSLKASYTPQRGGAERQVILDLEEFRNWLSSEAGLDVKSPDIEKQSAELAALFKRHSSSGPENIDIFQPRVMAMPGFTSSGWDSATTRMLPASLIPSVALGVIALVFYLLALRWIKHSAVSEAVARGAVAASVIVAATDPRHADETNTFHWELWWFSSSRGMQKLLCVVLGAILVLSLLCFFSFRMQTTTTADHSGVVRNLNDVTVGLGDPWLYLLHHKTGTRGGLSSGMNFFAGSALFGLAALFAGTALTRLTREQKRRGKLADVSTDIPQRSFFWHAVAGAAFFIAGGAGVVVHQAKIDLGPRWADAKGVHPDFMRPGVTSLALKKEIAGELRLTPAQLEQVNAILSRAYLDFLKLENDHSLFRSVKGHLVKEVKPFPDRSFDLAQRLAKELHDVAGKDIIDTPVRGEIWKLRLFGHAGEFNVRAEIWEQDGKFYIADVWEREGENISGKPEGIDSLRFVGSGSYVLDWEAQKEILHETRPDEETVGYSKGWDTMLVFIGLVRMDEVAQKLAADPKAVRAAADPRAALVTQAGTDLGRSCAESELKLHGIPFAKDATPEVLVKKLEQLLGAPLVP